MADSHCMNYSRIVGLISEIATWAPSSLFHLNIWISTHVKQDYYSTMANMQYLKSLEGGWGKKSTNNFFIKSCFDVGEGHLARQCRRKLRLILYRPQPEKKSLSPGNYLNVTSSPLFTLQWLQCCSCFTSSGDKSGWHSTPLGIYVVRYKVFNFSELLVILFLQP